MSTKSIDPGLVVQWKLTVAGSAVYPALTGVRLPEGVLRFVLLVGGTFHVVVVSSPHQSPRCGV